MDCEDVNKFSLNDILENIKYYRTLLPRSDILDINSLFGINDEYLNCLYEKVKESPIIRLPCEEHVRLFNYTLELNTRLLRIYDE